MYKFAAVLLLASVAIALPVGTEVEDEDLACLQESQTTAEAIDKFQTDNIYDKNDHNLKCYYKCSFLKFGAVDENGYFNAGKMLENVLDDAHSEENLSKAQKISLLEMCDNRHVVGDACERAFYISTCIVDLPNRLRQLASGITTSKR